ncbi:MAG: S8 family serine peptidase [Rubrobacter sp.]|nr:S8 family serine peptidase [Rubrobacter sp.]
MSCASILLVVVALSASFAGGEAGAQPEPPEEPSFQTPEDAEFVPGQIIVKLEEGVPEQALDALNRRNNAQVEEGLPGPLTAVVDLPVEQAVQRYEADPAVEWAEPDFILQPSDVTPNDPGFSDLYGLNNTGQSGGTEGADISAPGAWSVTTGSEDTIIAVIDTGVDIDHPDLEGNVWTNPDESANGRDDSGNGLVDDVNGWDFHNDDNSVYDEEDGDEHGTHVAGTVAAEGDNEVGVTGVNWQARIMPLKFLGPSGGFTSNAVKAIDYAVDNGATISNNSWGGGGESQAWLMFRRSAERRVKR